MNYPLFEEIAHVPREKLDAARLRDIGALVERALLNQHTHAEVQALIDDALEEAVGAEAKFELGKRARGIGAISAHEAGLAALGSLVMAVADRFNELSNRASLNGEMAFAEIGKAAVLVGVKSYLGHMRSRLREMGELIDSISR